MSRAQTFCLQAEELIRQAQRDETRAGELASQAFELYLQAAQADDALAEPYLGIAYLVCCAGHKQEALGLLESAREREPGNLRVEILASRIKRIKDASATPEGPAPAGLKPIQRLRGDLTPQKGFQIQNGVELLDFSRPEENR